MRKDQLSPADLEPILKLNKVKNQLILKEEMTMSFIVQQCHVVLESYQIAYSQFLQSGPFDTAYGPLYGY